MNKKGTDKILSVYWFVILFITAGGIIYMVSGFYGNPYDVREIEANIMLNKVAECLSEGIYLNKEIVENKENFFEECHLNFNVEDSYGWNNNQYYLEIRDFNIAEGNLNLKEVCNLKGEKSVSCVERNFYLPYSDEENKGVMINVLSVVRKTEKNAR